MSLRLVHNSEPVPEPEETAQEQDKLKGFAVLSNARMPGSGKPVDHVLIGPTGVFAVVRKRLHGNVEFSKGTVSVNGMARASIAEHVRQFTEALQRLVRVEFGNATIPITPVLCVEGAEPPRQASIDGVRVLSARGLGRLVQRAPKSLANRDVELVARVLASRLVQA